LDPADSLVAVLFADVSGSTRLYEQLGDVEAHAWISRCLDLATDCGNGHGGRLVKTVGDEVMFVFPTAGQAAAAAKEIQIRMSDLAATSKQRLAFRIGFHHGPAIERDGDFYGDSVNTAARLVALAKGGQIILSSSTAEALPPDVRAEVREVDTVTVKGKEQDISIVELVWQDSADLTSVVSRPAARAAGLVLMHRGRAIRLDATTAGVTLGRDAQNDVVIADKLASRLHAKIERRRDKFALIDQSSNGTYVQFDGENEFLLHREEVLLRGSGRLSFGHPTNDDPAELLSFACKNET
jgi:class 3 adenylate cyclase